MRKLLVASQKGGVGKTTSSINLAAATALAGSRVFLLDADPLSSVTTSLNLAQYPKRQTLRQAGIDLPGVFCSGVLPGLDVFSPYEDGSCTDEDLDELISLFDTPVFQAGYGCLIVDSPPFLGVNPGQLLAPCDEFILVMKAEPMAFRTLPAFLELVQRSKQSAPIKMRGILLTLPDGEKPGGHCERELRGRLGTRILPHVIAHDEEVAKAMLFGQIATNSLPDSPASLSYTAVAAALSLAAEAGQAPLHGASGFLLAAQHRVRNPRPADVVAAVPQLLPARDVLDVPPESQAADVAPVVVSPSKLAARLRMASRRPGREPALGDGSVPLQPAGESAPRVPQIAVASSIAAPTATPKTSNFHVPGAVWIGMGVLLGVSLNFLQLPPRALPISVGLAVGLFMVLILRIALLSPDRTRVKAVPAANNGRPRDSRKLVLHSEPKKNSSSRLVALARRAGTAPKNPESKRKRP